VKTALGEPRSRLSDSEADRRFMRMLAMVLADSREAEEAVVREVLQVGDASHGMITNVLVRSRQPPDPEPVATDESLELTHASIADRARHDHPRRLQPRGVDAVA